MSATRPKRSEQQSLLTGFDAGSSDSDEVAKIAKPQASDPTEMLESDPQPSPLTTHYSPLTPPPSPLTSHPSLPPLAGKTVYVVDSHSLIFQVFHALPEMTSAKGEGVAAVFGFVKDVLSLLENRQPDYLFCAFDMPGRTFRDQISADYKQHRTEMPVDLVPQISAIRRVLEKMGVPVLECPNFEADDILATFARIVAEQGGECFLVTGDKDCRQLLSDRVKIFNIRKNAVYDAAALREEWGISPEQVVDYQALVGDSVDNIKGVPGIGKKTAPELLQKYGSLDNLLAQAGQIERKKLRENLLAGREQALVSRELARLDVQTPIEIPWSAGAAENIRPSQAAEMFRDFGFRTLAAKWGSAGGEQLLLTPRETQFTVITQPQDLFAAVEKIRAARRFTMHLLTSHRSSRWAEIIGLALALPDDSAVYLPLRGPNPDAILDPLEAVAAVRGILEDEEIAKSGHDLKSAVVALRTQGVELRGMTFDTMIAGYLLDAGERRHSLTELAKRHLDQTAPAEPAAEPAGESRYDNVPLETLARYAVESASLSRRLEPILADKLAEAGLTELFCDVEMPLLGVLADLEFIGVRVDVHRLEVLNNNYRIRLIDLEREIHELAGHEFNIGSPKQLAQVLFDEQKLPVTKKTKTGASTDADVLEELAAVHPLPAKIIEYRQYAKLKNTYVDALPSLIHPVTGRVHASLNQAVAATGRLSSSEPNLQNIPIRSSAGREIRSAFLPGPDGWQLLAADYSQVELRVLAHFSRDEALLAAFARDEDIHTQVASQVYHVAADQVTKDMRRTAKAVNFGVIYGQSPFGLAKALGISQEDAAKFIDAYFNGYPGVERFLTQLLAECHTKGYVQTILGRQRAIHGVREPSAEQRGGSRSRTLPEREAINTVIQGSAADLIKLAMIHIERRLKAENRAAKLLLQIHDELMFEVPPAELPDIKRLVVEEMSAAFPLSVPLKVDLKCGRNWADCEPEA